MKVKTFTVLRYSVVTLYDPLGFCLRTIDEELGKFYSRSTNTFITVNERDSNFTGVLFPKKSERVFLPLFILHDYKKFT